MKTSHVCAAVAVVGSLAVPVSAQWLRYQTPGVPRLPDGKPNLAAPAPRAADGKPDLSGIWEPEGTKFIRNLAADLKPEDVSMHPWAEALYKERLSGALSKEEPDANCLPQGVPKINAAPVPWRIVQTPGMTIILYEAFGQWRQIFTDGRPLPEGSQPDVAGLLDRQMGRRHLRRRHDRVQRQGVARPAGASGERRPARDRAVPAAGVRPARTANHDRRSEGVHETVDGAREAAPAGGHRAAGIRLQRERTRSGAHGGEIGQAGLVG